jgi:hypothetical protein
MESLSPRCQIPPQGSQATGVGVGPCLLSTASHIVFDVFCGSRRKLPVQLISDDYHAAGLSENTKGRYHLAMMALKYLRLLTYQDRQTEICDFGDTLDDVPFSDSGNVFLRPLIAVVLALPWALFVLRRYAATRLVGLVGCT